MVPSRPALYNSFSDDLRAALRTISKKAGSHYNSTNKTNYKLLVKALPGQELKKAQSFRCVLRANNTSDRARFPECRCHLKRFEILRQKSTNALLQERQDTNHNLLKIEGKGYFVLAYEHKSEENRTKSHEHDTATILFLSPITTETHIKRNNTAL